MKDTGAESHVYRRTVSHQSSIGCTLSEHTVQTHPPPLSRLFRPFKEPSTHARRLNVRAPPAAERH